jgi:hypothetical protein
MSLSANLGRKISNWDNLELAAFYLCPSSHLRNADPQVDTLLKKGKAVIPTLIEQYGLNSVHASAHDSAIALSLSSSNSRYGDWGIPIQAAPVTSYEITLTTELADFETKIGRVRMDQSLDVLWRSISDFCPMLFELSRLIFSVPCSQTASEREFSLLRLIRTHLRGSLSPTTINQLLVSSYYVKQLNLQLDEAEKNRSAERSEASRARDNDRIRALLETNRSKKLWKCSNIDSAQALLQLNLQDILKGLNSSAVSGDDLVLPGLEEDDALALVPEPRTVVEKTRSGRKRKRALFAAEPEQPIFHDEEDWLVPAGKRRRTRRSQHEHEGGTDRGDGYLKYTLDRVPNDPSKMNVVCAEPGVATCRKPKQVFGNNLIYVNFENNCLIPTDVNDSLDLDTVVLPWNFQISLNQQGYLHFTDRSGFMNRVGNVFQIPSE